MFDKNCNNKGEVTLYELIDNELKRCWEMMDKSRNHEANLQAIFRKITGFHEMIEKLVDKAPNVEMYKTVKDLQEHIVERMLLEEQMKGDDVQQKDNS